MVARYALLTLAFVAGIASKPMLVSLPIALLLLDFWPLQRFQTENYLKLVWEKVPLFALAAASCVITLFAQNEGGAVRSLKPYSMGVRIDNAVVSYVSYIWKMLWPQNLAPFYPHLTNANPAWQVAGSALALALATVFAIRTARSRPYVLCGWLWYLVTLVPVIGLVQVGGQAMADRYTYIPFIGLFIIIAWGIPDLLAKSAPISERRGRQMAIAACAALLALTLCTNAYLHNWTDDVAFWRRVMSVSPGWSGGYWNLGLAFDQRRNPAAAAKQYSKALEIDPNRPDANAIPRATFCSRSGIVDQAVWHLPRGTQNQPKTPSCPKQPRIGSGHARQAGRGNQQIQGGPADRPEVSGRPEQPRDCAGRARASMRKRSRATHKVLRLRPKDYPTRLKMADALDLSGQMDKAVSVLKEAVRMQPAAPDAYAWLVTIYDRHGKRMSRWRRPGRRRALPQERESAVYSGCYSGNSGQDRRSDRSLWKRAPPRSEPLLGAQ